MADLVSRLYRLARVQKQDSAADAAHMRGALERLPQGKKKATLWKSWKKQFFVAERGLLLIFSDETCAAPLEKFELFGGKLEVIDDCTLMVCDRKENVLMLKCPGQNSLEEWSQALAANVSQDFSRTFVLPSPSNLHLNMFTNVLIIDFGGASVRAGVGSHVVSMPNLFFPSVVAVDCSNDHERYFGIDAFEESVRKRCRLTSPVIPSDKIDKLSVDMITLQGICEKIFKQLSIDPAHYEIQLSVPRPLSEQAKTAIATMFFEEFGVASLNMGHQTVFAFYAYNARSGVMVDLGERIDVVPIVEGYRVQAGTSRLPTGGKDLRSKLQHCLLGKNYSLTSFADDFITRYVVESAAYVALNAETELDKYSVAQDEMSHSLRVFEDPSSDSVADHAPLRTMTLGSERFEACEGLFKPELWGQDHAGVHVLVHKAIRECSLDVRKELSQSIFLAGGLSLLPGFRERLEAEMARLFTVRPRVHASPYRQHAAYLGASAHASTDAYHRTKVLRQDWATAGSKINSLWAL
jgi:actin-related protein